MNAPTTSHIEVSPNRAGQQRALIAGTRVRVQDIYAYAEVQGKTPGEIVASLPHLTLGQVHAALSYCFDHREDILRELQEDAHFAERMKAAAAPSLLQTRMATAEPGSDAVSS